MIQKYALGIHDEVTIANFGKGTIRMNIMTERDGSSIGILCMYNVEPHAPGRVLHGDPSIGLGSDELPKPDLVLRFENQAGVVSLINSLMDLQSRFVYALYELEQKRLQLRQEDQSDRAGYID